MIVIFSIIVLKYNLSAFVQPLSYEDTADIESRSVYGLQMPTAFTDYKLLVQERVLSNCALFYIEDTSIQFPSAERNSDIWGMK